MSKAEWKEHYRQTGPHDPAGCPVCAKRRATKRRNAQTRARDDAYRACGMVCARGALGGAYWE